ncbi:NADPH2:quinone reductase [Rhodoligotrophos appendicifer]|uniref:NAD(P)H-quinone oxidoreductase n=1 Tax=Rhodoligotrophos appendicifer TaxID=987056 RepID=UPI00195F556A|nr:NAD(P)H-quinone oxidoreductase [Rhodoligotrophos appendicifer]
MHDLPTEMTAIEITTPGGPEVLQPTRLAVPRPLDGQILIQVIAAGVNRPDVVQRQGHYPPPPGAPTTPGLEVAGRVVKIGPGVTRYQEGDTVCALVPGGGYAEYCVAAESNSLPIPSGLTPLEAGGLPETYFTVWTNVFQRGRLRQGEVLLVHGGTSGIGTTAIMLGRAFGARVFATAGSPEKCRACEELGAERGINYHDEDFVEIIRKETEGQGANVILDMVGGEYIPRNIEIAAPDGRIVSIAFLGGSSVKVNFLPVMLKRLILTGSTLRPRSVAQKAAIARELEAQVWPLFTSGEIKPVIDSTFPLEEASQAHQRLEQSGHIGKIILTT